MSDSRSDGNSSPPSSSPPPPDDDSSPPPPSSSDNSSPSPPPPSKDNSSPSPPPPPPSSQDNSSPSPPPPSSQDNSSPSPPPPPSQDNSSPSSSPPPPDNSNSSSPPPADNNNGSSKKDNNGPSNGNSGNGSSNGNNNNGASNGNNSNGSSNDSNNSNGSSNDSNNSNGSSNSNNNGSSKDDNNGSSNQPSRPPSPPSSTQSRNNVFSPPPPAGRNNQLPPTPQGSSDSPNSSTNNGDSNANGNIAIIAGVAAGAGLLLLLIILVVVVCARRKKKSEAPYFNDPSDDEYYKSQAQATGPSPYGYNTGEQVVVNMPPPNCSGGWGTPPTGSGGWGPPPPPNGSGGWGPPPPFPSNNQWMSSSDLSNSSYSGPVLPPPPPHPGMALGLGQSSFTFEELSIATGGFSQHNLLGQGGFGYVHKGVLSNGKEIAVKSLKSTGGQGDREFQAEVDVISRVHHRHLVSLVGYCISDSSRKLLVYEFVPNKTLEYHLHGKGRPVMDWPTRLRIAIGSAKGLAYLHEDCQPRIIHRDIKAANILIENNFDAKVADFGLAKMNQDTNTHVSTRVMGTFGYLAPEYAASGKLTDKSDVFSYGVMLLELVTGRRPVSNTHDYEEDSLVDWARPLCAKAVETGMLEGLVDIRLEDNYDKNEMLRLVACAGASVRHSAKRRPRMKQIVRVLEGDVSLDVLSLEGARPDQSSQFSGAPSGDYDSSAYGADMKRFRKVAHDSGNANASSEYGATSEYGLNPSSSSSDHSSTDNSGRIRSELHAL